MIITIKKGTLIKILLCIPIYIIACFSYEMSDYSQYVTSYSRIANGITTGYQMEFGYIAAEKIGTLLHMSYPVFRSVYVGIALTLLIISIFEYAKDTVVFAVVLYFIYPFFLDVVQTRHLMAVAITVFSIRFLKEYTIPNVIRYCACIILAVSQHTIALLYFFFIFAYKKYNIRKFFRVIVVIVIAEMVAMLGLSAEGIINRLYVFLLSRLLAVRGAGAFMLARTGAVNKYYLLMFGIMFFMYIILRDKYDASYGRIDDEMKGMYDLMMRISMMSLTFIPLININDHLARANRGMFTIIYIVFIEYASRKSSTSLKRLVYNLFPLGVAVLCFFMFLSPRSRGHWETVTVPILNNNYFIEALFGK